MIKWLFAANAARSWKTMPGSAPPAALPPTPPQDTPNSAYDFSEKVSALNDTPDTTYQYDPADIAANKGKAVCAYLGILILVPLLCAKDSRFARFHSNQGLVLIVVEAALSILKGIIVPILNSLNIVFVLAEIVAFVLMVIGIVNAAKGRAKELPIIGKITFIK